MVAVFLVIMGIVGGFGLALVAREWLKGQVARQQAKIAREEEK